jgi:hypothetical protein
MFDQYPLTTSYSIWESRCTPWEIASSSPPIPTWATATFCGTRFKCSVLQRGTHFYGPPAKHDSPVCPLIRPAIPPELRHPLEEHAPFRAILLPPRSVPPKSIRIPAKSARDERRRRREQHRAFSARVRFAGPDSDAPISAPSDTLNLDSNGKPLTYSSAKRGPDRLAWERAEAELRKSSDLS